MLDFLRARGAVHCNESKSFENEVFEFQNTFLKTDMVLIRIEGGLYIPLPIPLLTIYLMLLSAGYHLLDTRQEGEYFECSVGHFVSF